MQKFVGGVLMIGAVSATAVLSSGAAHAAPATPCMTPGSTVVDCIPVLPIAGSGSSGSSGRSFEVFDSGWFGLPPYIDEEINLAPERDTTPKEPIQVQPE